MDGAIFGWALILQESAIWEGPQQGGFLPHFTPSIIFHLPHPELAQSSALSTSEIEFCSKSEGVRRNSLPGQSGAEG